jgi:hypothetical protein
MHTHRSPRYSGGIPDDSQGTIQEPYKTRKILLFAIGLIAAAYSGAFLNAAQPPENLIIEGETYGLFSNPLASYWSA